eukprot:m.243741 g.243741  ORF g.243741 m.243741 type:complete len:363 (+) comp26365_c0_seq8:524-1612(+)
MDVRIPESPNGAVHSCRCILFNPAHVCSQASIVLLSMSNVSRRGAWGRPPLLCHICVRLRLRQCRLQRGRLPLLAPTDVGTAPVHLQLLRQVERADAFTGIRGLQAEIEQAWTRGFDPGGRQQLNGKVTGTRKWIGATECTALLRSRGYRTKIVDFESPPFGRPKPKGMRAQPDALMHWVVRLVALRPRVSASLSSLLLFLLTDIHLHIGQRTSTPTHLAISSGVSSTRVLHVVHSYFLGDVKNAVDRPALAMAPATKCPLYLQLHGHSRLIIGVVVPKTGAIVASTVALVVLDPAFAVAKVNRATTERPWSVPWKQSVIVPSSSLRATAYQIVYTETPERNQHQSAAEVACSEPSEHIKLI